jgi:hypothetical protein
VKEITGEIWSFHNEGAWIAITTNGTLNKSGELVMGKGIALEAKTRYPLLPKELSRKISLWGNIPIRLDSFRIYSFPTKDNWRYPSSLTLIGESCRLLVEGLNKEPIDTPLYIPRVGCGNGGLKWEVVKPLLEKYLDERFIVVNRL